MKNNFFENPDQWSDDSNIWEKFKAGMKSPEIYCGTLLKFSKKRERQPIPCFFSLQKDYLLFKRSSEQKNFTSALTLKYSYVEFPSIEEFASGHQHNLTGLFPFKITLKRKYTILFADSPSSFKSWMEALSQVSIRTDFHIQYRVSRCLGSGSFAYVYEAQNRYTNETVAVKGFNKKGLPSPRDKIVLWGEITTLRSLRHKNIVRLDQVHETTNSLYLVMEYVGGCDLKAYIKSKAYKVPATDIIQIMKGVLQGVAYLAERGYIHRDLKPSNVMLRKTRHISADDVVIVDFGLATPLSERRPAYEQCGTPGYIAPEVFDHRFHKGSSRLSKCDLFGAGCILYALITGASPFEGRYGKDANALLYYNRGGLIDFSSKRIMDSDPRLVDLLKGLLQRVPEERLAAIQAISNSIFGTILGIFNPYNTNGILPKSLCKEPQENLEKAQFKTCTDKSLKFTRKADHLNGKVNSLPNFNSKQYSEKLFSLPQARRKSPLATKVRNCLPVNIRKSGQGSTMQSNPLSMNQL